MKSDTNNRIILMEPGHDNKIHNELLLRGKEEIDKINDILTSREEKLEKISEERDMLLVNILIINTISIAILIIALIMIIF